MLAVPFQTSADDFVRGDCNLDGNVTISDVTCLIDYLLSDKWPGSGEPGEGEIETYVFCVTSDTSAFISLVTNH